MLKVNNIHFHLNGYNILNGINLSLERGNVYGLIGPNGAGKTTLLNIISGFLLPTDGETIWKGQKIPENYPHLTFTNGIIRTWQDARIFKNLTVMENLLCMDSSPGENLFNYLFKYKDVKEFEIQKNKKAREILKFLNLNSKENNLGQELSFGQQKLLSLGRMLMLNDLEEGDKCIFMDEPFTGVHEDLKSQISEVIKKIADSGNIVLIVEHNLEATFDLSDIILVMSNGKIEMNAKPEDIEQNDLMEYTKDYERPKP